METLKLSDEGAVRTVLLDRPDALNAFSSLLMDELCDAFLAAEADSSVKVLVLSGQGRAFSAGADLQEMGQKLPPPKHGFPGLLDAILDFSKPFIVAINGVGAGIGATIAGLSDLTFIAEGARLRCPFSALGLTAEAASTYTFPLLMGKQHASWFLLSAEWMSGQEVADAGLALRCFADDALIPETLRHAQKLAALPLASLQTTKALIRAPHIEQMRQTIDEENRRLNAMVGQPANREALTAFKEKREPDFTNL